MKEERGRLRQQRKGDQNKRDHAKGQGEDGIQIYSTSGTRTRDKPDYSRDEGLRRAQELRCKEEEKDDLDLALALVVCRDEYQVQTHVTKAAARNKDARNKDHRDQELPGAYSNKDLKEQGIKQQRPPGTRSSGSFRHHGPPGERKNGAQKTKPRTQPREAEKTLERAARRRGARPSSRWPRSARRT